MTPLEMKRQFDELLPWFLNGTLAKHERDWVEDYLRKHPEADKELRLGQVLRNSVREQAPEVSPEIGLDKLLHRIREERAFQRKPVKGPSLGERITEIFGGFKLTPAFAVAAGLVLIQGAIIGGLVFELDKVEQNARQAEYRALSVLPGVATSTPLLRVTFKPEASERDMRALLKTLGGTIINGPSQFGDYLILVEPSRIEALSDMAAKDPIVANVTIVKKHSE